MADRTKGNPLPTNRRRSSSQARRTNLGLCARTSDTSAGLPIRDLPSFSFLPCRAVRVGGRELANPIAPCRGHSTKGSVSITHPANCQNQQDPDEQADSQHHAYLR